MTGRTRPFLQSDTAVVVAFGIAFFMGAVIIGCGIYIGMPRESSKASACATRPFTRC
jgi:hypothetical protein